MTQPSDAELRADDNRILNVFRYRPTTALSLLLVFLVGMLIVLGAVFSALAWLAIKHSSVIQFAWRG